MRTWLVSVDHNYWARRARAGRMPLTLGSLKYHNYSNNRLDGNPEKTHTAQRSNEQARLAEQIFSSVSLPEPLCKIHHHCHLTPGSQHSVTFSNHIIWNDLWVKPRIELSASIRPHDVHNRWRELWETWAQPHYQQHISVHSTCDDARSLRYTASLTLLIIKLDITVCNEWLIVSEEKHFGLISATCASVTTHMLGSHQEDPDKLCLLNKSVVV